MRDAALSFAAEVERLIHSLPREEFHRRQGKAKVLLEEWYPISRLGLHLKQPGLEVDVEAFGDSGVADGRIEERGFRERTFDVQVTYVEDYEGSLRRELMYQQGYAPGAGPIQRNKATGTIDATMAAVDYDHNLKQAAAGIADRFSKKAANSYPANTVLLIAFEDMTLVGFKMWQALLALTQTHVTLISGSFKAVYVINCATNELVKAA
jgi:hypothetical protein